MQPECVCVYYNESALLSAEFMHCMHRALRMEWIRAQMSAQASQLDLSRWPGWLCLYFRLASMLMLFDHNCACSAEKHTHKARGTQHTDTHTRYGWTNIKYQLYYGHNVHLYYIGYPFVLSLSPSNLCN